MSLKPMIDRVRSGELLIADGAMGTNLLKRGLPVVISSESWVLNNPEPIIKLHKDFIAAGAQIILTCTFGANPYRLSESEASDKTIEINHAAVKLARQAIENRPIYVGGSIGPLGKMLQPFGPLSEDEAFSAYAEQIQALQHAGVDFLVIETQFDLAEATTAVRSAHSKSVLPIVVSFSYDRGTRTMMGVSPKKMAAEMSKLSVDMLGINCGRSLDENFEALIELKQATDLPIWFKPNAGLPKVDTTGNPSYDLPPQAMGDRVASWINAGANVIGGCCGTTPEHLVAIATASRIKISPTKEMGL
jgi:5-methyltetrahydrofolate--homocysteine methyltransferase